MRLRRGRKEAETTEAYALRPQGRTNCGRRGHTDCGREAFTSVTVLPGHHVTPGRATLCQQSRLPAVYEVCLCFGSGSLVLGELCRNTSDLSS